MDIGKSFTYMFEDPNWVAKLAIGGAILLVGVLFSWLIAIPLIAASAILLGYMLTVLKNVAEGSTTPLPEWNDFGALFMKGLYAVIGSLIIYIPTLLIVCCIVATTSVMNNAAASGDQSTSNTAGAAGLVLACLQCVNFLYALVAALYLYAPLSRYAMGGQLSTFWDFSGNLSFIRTNSGNYIIAFLLGPIVASFVAGFGVIACVIGAFFTAFWAYLVTAHLFGQVMRNASGQTPVYPAPSMPPMAPPPMAPSTPA